MLRDPSCVAGDAALGLAFAQPQGSEDISTIGGAIARQARVRGDCAALVGAGSAEVTFRQLLASITRIAEDLASAGIQRDDRVGLLVPAGVAGGRVTVALACTITLVPFNPALTPHEIVELATTTGLKAMVIPRWLETPARAAVLQEGMAVFEAVLGPDLTLGLELLTPAPAAATVLRGAREGDIALLLRTSGTTGAPKLIPVTHLNLVAMAEKLGSSLWFNISARDRAACTSPLYYAAGLKTSLFVPLMLGASVGFPPAGRTFDVAEWLDILKPTFLSVAPGPLNAMVDRLKARAQEFDGSSLRFVMCGSAYLPDELRHTAQSLLRVPVLDFYGLSEAGVMAANPVPPGRMKPGTVGLPAPGELALVDEKFETVARGEVGQIMVTGPCVMPGYAVVDGASGAGLERGWLPTGDLGRIDADGYLSIVGRLKEVIDRGGEKIFPYEIEKALLQHPAVLEAAAFGVPHPRLGQNVAAAAVLKPGVTAAELELKDFLAGRLAAFKLPRRIYLVPNLPRGSTGKVLRSELGQTYGAARPEMAQPQEWLEFELHDLWGRLLRTDDIGVDDDFFELGGDSLLATDMLLEVERLTGMPYPQAELSTLTIRHITDVVMSSLAVERDLITQLKAGSGIPLFFCHGDYATRGVYMHRLACALKGDQPVFLLHCYPDRPIGSSIEDIAAVYLREVLRVAPPNSPVCVAGYCNGGMTAWHLTHLLRSRGVKVTDLLLLETMSLNALPVLRAWPPMFAAAGALLPGRVGRFLREDAMRAMWILVRRGPAGFLAGVARVLRRKALSQPEPEQPPPGPRLTVYLDGKKYYQLIARYVPPPIDVGVTCIIADEGVPFDIDPDRWRRIAPSVRVLSTPGTHFTMVMTGREALAAAIDEALNRAGARRAVQ